MRHSSVVERFPNTKEVAGSFPVVSRDELSTSYALIRYGREKVQLRLSNNEFTKRENLYRRSFYKRYERWLYGFRYFDSQGY